MSSYFTRSHAEFRQPRLYLQTAAMVVSIAARVAAFGCLWRAVDGLSVDVGVGDVIGVALAFVTCVIFPGRGVMAPIGAFIAVAAVWALREEQVVPDEELFFGFTALMLLLAAAAVESLWTRGLGTLRPFARTVTVWLGGGMAATYALLSAFWLALPYRPDDSTVLAESSSLSFVGRPTVLEGESAVLLIAVAVALVVMFVAPLVRPLREKTLGPRNELACIVTEPLVVGLVCSMLATVLVDDVAYSNAALAGGLVAGVALWLAAARIANPTAKDRVVLPVASVVAVFLGGGALWTLGTGVGTGRVAAGLLGLVFLGGGSALCAATALRRVRSSSLN